MQEQFRARRCCGACRPAGKPGLVYFHNPFDPVQTFLVRRAQNSSVAAAQNCAGGGHALPAAIARLPRDLIGKPDEAGRLRDAMARQQGGQGGSRAGCIAAPMPRQGQAKPYRGDIMGCGQCRQLGLRFARCRLQTFQRQVERNPRIVRRQPRRPLEPAQPVSAAGARPGGGRPAMSGIRCVMRGKGAAF